MKKNLLLVLLGFLMSQSVNATHNRAGEIRFVQTGELSIRAELITYTKTSSSSADRDTITLFWGDGTFSTIQRANGQGFILPNDIKMNVYIMQHEYPGRGDYIISVLDPNRVDNILNVDPPNSVNIPFFIQTKVKLFNSNFQGLNSSPQLTNPPIDFACVNQLFVHNPGAIDLDDDSLAFELIIPLMDQNENVPNYLFPNQIRPGINNNISLDPRTGNFIWSTPQLEGEYNIAILIKEYRKAQLISSTIRDMQIFVRQDCNKNNPPTIIGRRDTCIIAGQTLNTSFIIDDLDRNQRGGKVKTQVFGAAFLIPPIATTNATGNFETTPYNLSLHWMTDCNHVRNDPYNIIIKATDNFFDTSGLSNTFIYRVKILGPSPVNLQTSSDARNIYLDWNYPYFCDNAKNNFVGFSVWRKELPGTFTDSCNPGLQKYAYTQIAYLVKDFAANKYFYTDTTAEKNKNYCYRAQAEFALKSPAGFLYNFTPSLPSNESCSSLRSNEPIILHVDVRETSNNTGQIFIDYHRPFVPDFDTSIIRAPYEVSLLHSTDNINFNTLTNFNKTFQSFSAINDTSYLHENLNTNTNFHTYKVRIHSSSSGMEVVSESAQSIYLTARNDNKGILLNWSNKVPWINERFVIYRKLSSATNFDSISTVITTQFKDGNIKIDSSYCYLVKSVGQYTHSSILRPLINYSNEVCIIALDSTPPCCPLVSVLGPCELNDSLKVVIRWEFREDSCASLDIERFQLHEIRGDAIIKVADLPADSREFQIDNISVLNSCFTITAYNKKQLSCSSSNSCPSFCPEFELPNTFTPNGDGFNDVFKPIKFRQIFKFDFTIFNQWGDKIYFTDSKEISWNGNNLKGKKCNDGTYYYIGHYSTRQETKEINGFIELLSGQ